LIMAILTGVRWNLVFWFASLLSPGKLNTSSCIYWPFVPLPLRIPCLWTQFISIFTMLIVSIQEHGRSFHLLMSLSSFFRGLEFSLKRSLVSFVKFISRYFIVFEDIVSWIVSLISFSVC
jgi:hypothetical protein